MSLINSAFAETATAPAAPSAGEQLMSTLSMFGPILIIFYFLLIRPQQRKLKEHQAMVAALKRGDKIITSGGIIGRITKVNTEKATLNIEIADEVEIEILASTVASLFEISSTPINDNKKTAKK